MSEVKVAPSENHIFLNSSKFSRKYLWNSNNVQMCFDTTLPVLLIYYFLAWKLEVAGYERNSEVTGFHRTVFQLEVVRSVVSRTWIQHPIRVVHSLLGTYNPTEPVAAEISKKCCFLQRFHTRIREARICELWNKSTLPVSIWIETNEDFLPGPMHFPSSSLHSCSPGNAHSFFVERKNWDACANHCDYLLQYYNLRYPVECWANIFVLNHA